MKQKKGMSIKEKIFILASLGTTMFLVVAIYLLVSLVNYNKVYDHIITNLTIANDYNLQFKEEIDESLYKMVVGYVHFGKTYEEGGVEDPYVLLEDIGESFSKLKERTKDPESKVWLDSLQRNIDTLKDRVDDLKEQVDAGGTYDENIRELDNNIYILTELIQEDIQYYIYYQTEYMEAVKKDMDLQIRQFVVLLSVLLVFLVGISALLTFTIGMGIIGPIRELSQATEKVSEGDFSARANVDTNDEIAVLADEFNHMAENMGKLVDKVREDEQKMRQADLRLLQEQINPHFLYNTLDTIVWLIEDNEMEQAVDMVVTLSVFFRLVLSKGKEFISIKMEKQHIQSYLEIQEKRYRDILEYAIDIDPKLYDYQILKLTLQPLVENALYHGIKYLRAKGTILISGRLDHDIVELSVLDTGVGMGLEELEELRNSIEKPCKDTDKGFGLANVNERIRMYFGNEYGLAIESEKGKGTCVTLRIPAVKISDEQI